MNKAHVLVFSGDGLNCENETLRAFQLAGASGEILHINKILETPKILEQFNIMAIPGGFSFGDEINSGQILALKIRHGLKNEFNQFVNSNKLIIGICNGFQTLIKLGAFTSTEQKFVTLAHNSQNKFIDQWANLKIVENTKCIWTKDLKALDLPIRHGEGKIIFAGNENENYQKLLRNGQIAIKYEQNINGSYEQIAGICDESGRIFGLMPHPEAAINQLTNPFAPLKNQLNESYKIFKNAVNYIEQAHL